jgi:hypothetical protein
MGVKEMYKDSSTGFTLRTVWCAQSGPGGGYGGETANEGTSRSCVVVSVRCRQVVCGVVRPGGECCGVYRCAGRVLSVVCVVEACAGYVAL